MAGPRNLFANGNVRARPRAFVDKGLVLLVANDRLRPEATIEDRIPGTRVAAGEDAAARIEVRRYRIWGTP